ncbi:nicotinate-nucleotide adenylyltransferase [Lachnospiraceae bacterium OttesenSCG-928-D06]|nr:nicotinate-nucleotide adenylyltransferase [Lachnospiraceae bacterium OttesenSCG-928-D06]
MKKIKTGIMGGTFNPIHMGHLLLAEWAMDFAGLDRVIFLPSGVPYQKVGKSLLDGKIRLEMVELAVSDHKKFSCSDMEIEREGYTYTYETLELFSECYPDEEFFFILGADCLFSIEHWKCPDKIFEACTLIAAVRGDVKIHEMEKKKTELTERFDAHIMLMPFLNLDISSTNIRERVSLSKSICYLVPENVRQYIINHALYLS